MKRLTNQQSDRTYLRPMQVCYARLARKALEVSYLILDPNVFTAFGLARKACTRYR